MIKWKQTTAIFVQEGKGWTGRFRSVLQASKQAFDEMGFSRAEISGQAHHVVRAKTSRPVTSKGDGFGNAIRNVRIHEATLAF